MKALALTLTALGLCGCNPSLGLGDGKKWDVMCPGHSPFTVTMQYGVFWDQGGRQVIVPTSCLLVEIPE